MDTTLHDPLIGQFLDRRYRVDERIAVGGMATVYRAEDTRLERVVALKVMHPSLAQDAGFVERFSREAKSVARLDHANVVGVLDQGADGPYVYLAMEYVAGCTLREMLRDRGGLPVRAVLDILEPVLAGLAAAHRAGLVHRDIKPENVLIGDDGRVKVADFGLVRGVDAQTSATTGALLGTVSYLAPELIEHGLCDTRSDVYACGLMLYELLTGAKPHTGASAAQVLFAHVNEDVPAPSQAVPGLPAALDDLVGRATARDPRERPADAAALLAQLREVRAGLSEEQLSTAPPTGAGPEDPTAVVSRPPVDATARIELPADPPGGPAPPAGGRGRARRRLPRRGLLTLVGGLLLALAAATGVWYVNSGQFLRTPGVYDMTQAEAEATLRETGLQVRVERAFSETVEPGHVIATDPERGARIRRNATVVLTVSQGPPVAEVPNVRGLTLAAARKELTEAGLTPREETRAFSTEVPRGSVIETDPPAGAERRPNSPVDLVVSRGAPLPVPNVVGQTREVARQVLTQAGFRVAVSARRVHAAQQAGTVATQSPESGRRAGQGDTVTLTFSKGPELVEVPDVRGMGESEAVRVLEDAGFQVDVNRVFVLGQVFNQSIRGEKAPRGTTITIWVR